jgi:hypothetical protein
VDKPCDSAEKSYKVGEKEPLFRSTDEKVQFERRQQNAAANVLKRNERIQSESWELAQQIRVGD